jgi:hypothetical protein
VGWTSWLLFGGGWRALTPYAAAEPGGPRAMLRLDPREPRDLGADVARWAAEVPR